MNIKIALSKFLVDRSVYCSKKTIDYYSSNINAFINCCGIIDTDDLSRDCYKKYILYLRSRNIKNTSVRTYAMAVKVFLCYLCEQGIISDRFYLGVKLPKVDNSLIIPLSSSEVECCHIALCSNEFLKYRNLLIFYLMLDAGFRSQEVLHLKFKHVNIDSRYLIVENSKECKSRIVPMSQNLVELFISYDRKGKPDEYVFLKKDTLPLSESAIKNIFRRLKVSSGVDRVHPHLLRHTFATSFIVGGGDLETLRLLLGHYDYSVTKNYLHLAAQYKFMDADIYKLDKIFFKKGY